MRSATSFSTAVAAATTVALMLIFVHCAFFHGVADAGAPPCDCYNGGVEQAAPRCLCACSGEYLQPMCAYTSTDMVNIEFWLDIPQTQFLSVELGDDISKNIGISRLQVDFRKTEDNSFNKTNAFYRIPGERVHLLKQDVQERVYWTTLYRIESMFLVLPTYSPPAEFTNRWPIFVTDDGKYTITIEMIGWLIGSLGVTVFGILVECCCMSNTAEDTEIMIEEGRWDPLVGPVKPGTTPRPSTLKNPLTPEEEADEQNKAATKIQCAARKRAAKRKLEEKKKQRQAAGTAREQDTV